MYLQVDDPAVLPSYYYREDALLLYDAIKSYVTKYVSLYYGMMTDKFLKYIIFFICFCSHIIVLFISTKKYGFKPTSFPIIWFYEYIYDQSPYVFFRHPRPTSSTSISDKMRLNIATRWICSIDIPAIFILYMKNSGSIPRNACVACET